MMRLALLRRAVRIIPGITSTDGLLPLILKTRRQFLLTISNRVRASPNVRCNVFRAVLWKYTSGFPIRKNNTILASIISKAIRHAKSNGLLKALEKDLKPIPCDAIGHTFVPIPFQPLLGNIIVLLVGCAVGAIVLACEVCRKYCATLFDALFLIIRSVFQGIHGHNSTSVLRY